MKLTHASGGVLVSDQAPALAPRKHISVGVNLKKSKMRHSGRHQGVRTRARSSPAAISVPGAACSTRT